MEMEGWKILFGRSVEKCKLKYVCVVSDGDSNGFQAKMIPVYKRIVTSHLLESCKGATQNNNESLHNVIWTELPKTKFFGLQRMLYGVHRGVTKFNLGHAAAEVERSGEFAAKAAKEKDITRVNNAKRKMQCKEDRKRKKIKAIQEEESKKRAEGTTYEAGGAALPT